jgi:2'-5' RNA ligase
MMNTVFLYSLIMPVTGRERPANEPVSGVVRRHRLFGPTTDDAPRQLSLDGMALGSALHTPARPPSRKQAADFYNLLFAVYPEAEDAARIAAEGARLVRALHLRDKPQAPERLHMTLCSLGCFAAVPLAFIDAARAAANGLSCPGLPLLFSSARSFKADGAFALYGDGSTAVAAARLRRPLMAALKRHGLRATASTTPHVSLVYNCGAVVQAPDIAPLGWTARRFSLVVSHIGLTHHEFIAEWPLSTAQ